MTKLKYDFYYSAHDNPVGTFKDKIYTERTLHGVKPNSRRSDLVKIGEGSFEDIKLGSSNRKAG